MKGIRLSVKIGLIVFFSGIVGSAVAQTKIPPARNLWIIACANGGNLKTTKSFQLLAALLKSQYGLAAGDTASLVAFLPDLTHLAQANSEGPDIDLTTIPLTYPANDDTLAASLAVQYNEAAQEKLDKSLGLIYPHLLVKELFSAYTKKAYPPYSFDTIRTVIFSSQNNIYYERTKETQSAIDQNESLIRQKLGDWYSLLSDEKDDTYLQKIITRRVGDLYVKISQLTATAAPSGLDRDRFDRFIKSRTRISRYRDSFHIGIRFGPSFYGIPISGLQYAFTNRGSKIFMPAVDSIHHDDDYALPDSIRMRVAFLIGDPLLGKKIIHRSYTLEFPPKAGFRDYLVLYRGWWIAAAVLFLSLIVYFIWWTFRQQKLRIYKAGFYSLFKEVTEDEQQLPNKIQLFVFRFSNSGQSHIIVQPGHKKNAVQAFLFEGRKLVVTSKEKIFRQEPFLLSPEFQDGTLEIQWLRTSIRKLSRSFKKGAPMAWMQAMTQALPPAVTIDCTEVAATVTLTAHNKPAAQLYFSRTRSFPRLPPYYNYKTEALFFATHAINEWIRSTGSWAIGHYHIIVCMPGYKAGLLYAHFLEPAAVQITYFDTIHVAGIEEAAVNDLLEGFLANDGRCPVLLVGAGLSAGAAFYMPPGKKRDEEVTMAAKKLWAAVDKNSTVTRQEIAPDASAVFTFDLLQSGGYAEPVFTWQAPLYPLQLALVKTFSLGGKLQKTFIRRLPLTPEGTAAARFTVRGKWNHTLYLAPSVYPLYIRHINPVEKFYFQKSVSVLLELNLPGRQLLINEKSYDIRL